MVLKTAESISLEYPEAHTPEELWAAAEACTGAIELLADPTRIAILALLKGGEKFVGELCGALGQHQPSTSHHLALLRLGRIVESRREGKHNFYSLTPKGRKLFELAAAVALAEDE
jgi:DNA-binding transcriptional ArsR family regulator